MKFKIVKAAFATACVVAAGMGCLKAYNVSDQSKESMLLAENVEALSEEDGDSGKVRVKCYSSLVYELGASVVDCATCKSKDDHTDALFCIHDWCWQQQ